MLLVCLRVFFKSCMYLAPAAVCLRPGTGYLFFFKLPSFNFGLNIYFLAGYILPDTRC
jgi:hypothetical protein